MKKIKSKYNKKSNGAKILERIEYFFIITICLVSNVLVSFLKHNPDRLQEIGPVLPRLPD